MVQLEKFSFQRGEAIIFDLDGELADIGAMRELDQKAMLDRCFIDEDPDDDPLCSGGAIFGSERPHTTPAC
jgi:hypothetical protein